MDREEGTLPRSARRSERLASVGPGLMDREEAAGQGHHRLDNARRASVGPGLMDREEEVRTLTVSGATNELQ